MYTKQQKSQLTREIHQLSIHLLEVKDCIAKQDGYERKFYMGELIRPIDISNMEQDIRVKIKLRKMMDSK